MPRLTPATLLKEAQKLGIGLVHHHGVWEAYLKDDPKPVLISHPEFSEIHKFIVGTMAVVASFTAAGIVPEVKPEDLVHLR